MELWRSSESSSGVYLSPADTPDSLDLDNSEGWSDSEFEDDFDDDPADRQKDQDCISQSSSYASSSGVSGSSCN